MKVKNYSVRGLIEQLLTSTYGDKGIDEPTNVTNVVVGGDGNGDVKIYLTVDDAIQRPQINQEVSIDQISSRIAKKVTEEVMRQLKENLQKLGVKGGNIATDFWGNIRENY